VLKSKTVNKTKETQRLENLSHDEAVNEAKRYKLPQAALEIIKQAGKIHAQQSRAIQIAIEIMWRTPGEIEVPESMRTSPLVGKTYKLPRRTVALIEALAKEYQCTLGNVL
jgi:hypothetical protein